MVKVRDHIYFFIKKRKGISIALLVFCLFALLFFAGSPSVANYVMGRVQINVAIHRFDNMSREDMIYDFEYLITAMEENWPFFNVSISANGVDVHVLADNMRAILSDTATEINHPLDFSDLMQAHFFEPINQLGHLRQVRNAEVFFGDREFYAARMEAGIRGRTILYYYEVFNRMESIYFYTRMRELDRGDPARPPQLGSVYEFDILEEGQIAYMNVNRMVDIGGSGRWQIGDRYTSPYEQYAIDFSNEISGFSHLIIDFRSNRGGQSFHFDAYIMPIFLTRPIQFRGYVFYMDGKYSNISQDIFDVDRYFGRRTEPRHRAARVTGERDMPYLDTTIGLANQFFSNHAIATRQRWGARAYWDAHFGDDWVPHTPFGGQIWLLVGENTASAAEGVAALLKYNNIATLVGDPTWGIMGNVFEPTTISISLPNTGILVRMDVAYYTDIYGRPLQGYGIQPHYPNRPGMDALETVLAIIAERNGN